MWPVKKVLEAVLCSSEKRFFTDKGATEPKEKKTALGSKFHRSKGVDAIKVFFVVLASHLLVQDG